ncbi:MAG: hypothetical protein LUE90_08570 [Clostridiales bacterium]|nr:hypothetical protein [Clostridiales bacterium]
METLFHLAASMYTVYRDDLAVGMLACTFLLMIAALFAVRRCRRQIRELTEKTREVTKAVLSQGGRTKAGEAAGRPSAAETAGGGRPAVQYRDEELFGNVIREIFP